MSNRQRKVKRKQANTSRSSGGRRQSEQLNALLGEAVGLREQGRLAEAAVSFRKALRINPQHPAALQHLALLKNDLGAPDEAVALLRKSLSHTPQDPVCQNNLGNVLRSQGKTEESLQAYKAALVLDPGYVNALFNMGIAFDQPGSIALEQALGYLERAAQLAPGDVQTWEAIGKVSSRLQKPDAAARAFETALGIDPSRADARSGLGSVALTKGDVDDAIGHFRKAVELQPRHPHAIEYLARSRKYSLDDMAEIQRIADTLSHVDDEEEACILHFALGKMYDDCALFDKAFDHYQVGNAIRHSQSSLNPEAIIDDVSAIINVFSKEFFGSRRDFGCQSELPVLIVGPPRSGTTLVEQIVASHGEAAGAGEVPFLNDLVLSHAERSGVSFPAFVESIDKDVSVSLANHYLQQLAAVGPNMIRITDKAISGGLQLGLLALLFPRARVIYCKRDLLSVGLSIYFQRFAPGSVLFSYDLRSIGIYCNQYARLMRHWHDVLPLPIHDVNYEEMVGNQESMTRELISFCGLAWDEQCLSFYETKRSVHTASHWQVRQPIYKHSVNRAESYREFIGALREEIAVAGN